MTGKKTDVMIDIETLGTKNPTVFQIAAVPFNIATGEIFYADATNLIVDISKCKIDADGETIKWWLTTNADLFKRLLMAGNLSEEEALKSFEQWFLSLGEDCKLWGNGILFDNNIIQSRMGLYGITYPVKYDKDADVRTILELACAKTGIDKKEMKKLFEEDTDEKHDALSDVLFQIRLVCGCYKSLMS